jgi:hypothetical protein
MQLKRLDIMISEKKKTDRLADFPNRIFDVVDATVVLLVLALVLLAATVAEAVTNVHRAEPVKYDAFLVLFTNSYASFCISKRFSVSFNNEQDFIGERCGSPV